MPETILNQEEEKKLIMHAYRKLLKSIKSKMDSTDRSNIRMAYEIAVDAHSKQRRKSGEPYILHPIEVARICAEEIGLGPTAIVAALLHDVVEDTEVTLDQIKTQFGERIAKIVDGLTKLDGLYNVASPQAENFKKVLTTLLEDVRVILIKMADRLHNMRTLGSMPRHKQLKIAAETTFIYAPLAHRLGLYSFKTEFQDLAMKINEPELYEEIEQKLHETKQERTRYINEFLKPLNEELNEIGYPYRTTGRPKSIYSIANKIKTKNVPFEEIYDLFAVRIIVDVPQKKEKQICWQIYSIVTDVHTPIAERLKDWITTPKSNGYESLHTTVIGPEGRYVEVQIRSERMDEVAEKGFAAHWKYKGINGQPDLFESWFDSVRDILENPDTDSVEFLSDFKSNLFHDEVYVYTPKGDLQILPQGATALDFAFSIHSDIGYHCTAIKVNKKLVPFGYKLQNGDQVSVTTNKSQKPTEDWVKMVVTGKARSKIRSAMKEERKKAGEIGKESLQRKLKGMKVDLEANIDMLVKFFGYNSHADFYFEIAMGRVALNEFKNYFKVESHKLVEIQEQTKQETTTEAPQVTRSRKELIKPRLLINGDPADKYEYSLANCCTPVMGDDVFAFLSIGSGAKIHRTSCPNAVHLMANYGYRVMKAEWVSSGDTSFVVDLKITGIDKGPGVIERLSHSISTDLGLNIRSFYIDGKEGYFVGKVSLLVLNKNQLNVAIKGLKNLPEVSTVVRIED
jgi:GTP diphosphokinase / guanosine-3',5'-bis(diphosphate) 3'-diphosphatase